MYWIEFFISSVFIILAGIRLTIYSDKLSDKLKLGKLWIGVVLLGFVTSLPEAITSFVSVVSLSADDLAIGNLVGSNVYNVMFIVFMDIMVRDKSITDLFVAKKSHFVSAYFAMIMSALVGLEVFLSVRGLHFQINTLSVFTVTIAIAYFIGMNMLYRIDKGNDKNDMESKPCADSLKVIYINLFVSAVVVVAGAMVLANSSDIIAAKTGLGRTFIGSILLAFVTSLPEFVVTISSIRMGAFDLAIGNIFGSNMVNNFILVLCDLMDSGYSILSKVSFTHGFTAVLSIVMTYAVIVGLKTKNKKTYFGLAWDTWLLLIFFILGYRIIYSLR